MPNVGPIGGPVWAILRGVYPGGLYKYMFISREPAHRVKTPQFGDWATPMKKAGSAPVIPLTETHMTQLFIFIYAITDFVKKIFKR